MKESKIGEIVKQLSVVSTTALLVAMSVPAAAETAFPTLRPFTAMCIADDSIGYSFLDGTTKRTVFRPDTHYVVKTVDPKLYTTADPEAKATGYGLCKWLQPMRLSDGSAWTFACYDVRKPAYGTFPVARNCREKWDKDDKLVEIDCPDLSLAFNPSGRFVQVSSATVASVVSILTGKCSVIE